MGMSNLQTGDGYPVTPPVTLRWVPAQFVRLCKTWSTSTKRDWSCNLLFCHSIRIASRAYSRVRDKE